MKTYTQATDDFLKECDFLGDADTAIVTHMQNVAAQLDDRFQTSLAAEYGKTERYIRSLAPVEGDVDEDDDLLSPESD